MSELSRGLPVRMDAPRPDATLGGVAAPQVLKGPAFAERLRRICASPPRPRPLDGARYRHVLIPGLTGGEIQFALVGLLGRALQLRGARVTAVMCDAQLEACTLRKVDHHEAACSRWCHKHAALFAEAADLPHRWYSEFLSPDLERECLEQAARAPVEQLTSAMLRGVRLGEHVRRSVESYFRVGAYDPGDARMVAKAREMFAAGLGLIWIAERAIDELQPDKLLLDDGQKIDWGVWRDVARQRGLPIDVVLGAPRGHTLLLEHDSGPQPSEPYPRWPHWRDQPLTAQQDHALDAYFQQRATRPYEDQQWADVTQAQDAGALRQALGLAPRPDALVLSVFPNLSWDAAVTTTHPAYPTAAAWVLDTVAALRDATQVQVLIKTHPAELYQGARDPLCEQLQARFGTLPPHVRLLPPDTSITAHDVLRVSDAALVYTSTVALEALYFGVPVLNSGGGWHAGRGLTHDAATPEQYRALLSTLSRGERLPAPPVDLARRYAYMVFFRSAPRIRHFDALFPNVTALNIESLAALLPGSDETVDLACAGVLCGAPFECSA